MSVQSATKQMADALADAKHSLETSKQQVTYWETQVIVIGKAYAAITEILPPESFDTAATSHKKPGAKGAKKAHKGDLPKTDSAFWLGLITTTPQKTADILIAAAVKANVDQANKESMAALKGRMASNLTNLVNDKKIKSEGERLTRAYFL